MCSMNDYDNYYILLNKQKHPGCSRKSVRSIRNSIQCKQVYVRPKTLISAEVKKSLINTIAKYSL